MQHQIKHILYVIPEDLKRDTIIAKVFGFAAKKKAQITFLEILNHIPAEIKKILNQHHELDVVESLKKEAEKKIEDKIIHHAHHQVEHKVKVLIGNRSQLTLEELNKYKYDLLITTHFKTTKSFSEKIFGSRYMFLLRQSPCPVLIFRPKRKKQKYNMLVAINTEEMDEHDLALNRKIIDYALSASMYDNVDIHIVQCWRLYGESSFKYGFLRVSQEKLNAMLKDTKNYFHKQFYTFLEYLPKTKHKIITKLIKGEPTVVIPDYIEKNNIDMLVIGTISRSGLSGITIGNVAEDILQSVDCSVMAVKPDKSKFD